MTVSDYEGNPLSEGSRVRAWRFGVEYTATVKEIRHPDRAGDGYRDIVLIRDDDQAEEISFSDAVVVVPGTDDKEG